MESIILGMVYEGLILINGPAVLNDQRVVIVRSLAWLLLHFISFSLLMQCILKGVRETKRSV